MAYKTSIIQYFFYFAPKFKKSRVSKRATFRNPLSSNLFGFYVITVLGKLVLNVSVCRYLGFELLMLLYV
jgi:hypothetical protein